MVYSVGLLPAAKRAFQHRAEVATVGGQVGLEPKRTSVEGYVKIGPRLQASEGVKVSTVAVVAAPMPAAVFSADGEDAPVEGHEGRAREGREPPIAVGAGAEAARHNDLTVPGRAVDLLGRDRERRGGRPGGSLRRARGGGGRPGGRGESTKPGRTDPEKTASGKSHGKERGLWGKTTYKIRRQEDQALIPFQVRNVRSRKKDA